MDTRDTNSLRILHAAYWHTTACVDYVNVLAEKHSVMFISTRKGVRWLVEDEWRDIFNPRIRLRVERDRARKNPLYYIERFMGIYRGARQFHADVIHVQETTDPFANGLLARLDVPIVLTVHDPVPHIGEKLPQYQRNTPQRLALRRRAEWIITHGHDVREQLLKVQPELSPDRVSVILHGGIDYMRRWLRPEYEEKQGSILFFGRINAYKGLGVLVEAWKQIRQECPNARLVIAGKGYDLPNYRNMLIADDRCEMIEEVIPTQEVVRLYAEASVVVLPYLEATQSGPLAIAVALGKPVVATEVGGLPDLIDRDRSGLIVPPKDPKAFAEAVIRVLKDDDLRKRLSEGTVHVSQTRLSSNEIAQQTEEVYRRAIDLRKHRRGETQ